MTDKPCRFVATDQPRVIPGEHADTCERPETCRGCAPCLERHCAVCGRVHVDGTCAECVGRVREDLHTIGELCGALPDEVRHRGINGEAMMLLGPAADPEAWRNQATSAMLGRLDDAYLEDCRDEQHPLWVLGTWEQLWREHLDQPTDLPATLERLVDYLDDQFTHMARQDEPPFEDFARDIRQCRGHLEDVLSDGVREERGAPCPKCGEGALVKDHGARIEDDRWLCRRCHSWWTEQDYRSKVAATYELHADALPASAIARVYRVPEGSVRAWASGEQPRVRKRGRNEAGLQLYDVADTLAMRDRRKEPA